jgi:hypothetical protein
LRNLDRFVDAFVLQSDDAMYLSLSGVFRSDKPGGRWIVPTRTVRRPPAG